MKYIKMILKNKYLIFTVLFSSILVMFPNKTIKSGAHPGPESSYQRVFNKDSSLIEDSRPNQSGYLLYEGNYEEEAFRFFYFSDVETEENNLITLQAKDVKTPGALMNMSMFNGISSVKVTFTGGPLYGVLTKSLFENFNIIDESFLISSNDAIVGQKDEGYLLLLAPSITPINISKLEINFSCDHEVDQNFYYDEFNAIRYARSVFGSIKTEHDLTLLETAPTLTTNNYSLGQTLGYNNSWYRWNGTAIKNYYQQGEVIDYSLTNFGNTASNNFSIQVTAFIDPAIFYSNQWFHLAPWVHLRDINHQELIDGEAYIMSYMGDDNYDPIGAINPRNDTYRGRFFTNYDAGGGGYPYGFVDPDLNNVIDDVITLREAYETINLPFFNVVFEVYGNRTTLYINGFKIYEDDAYFYNDYQNELYTIYQIHLQAINYGNSDGTPKSAYAYGFSNPIIRYGENIII